MHSARSIVAGDPDTAIRVNGAGFHMWTGDDYDFAGTASLSVEAWVYMQDIDAETRLIMSKELDGLEVQLAPESLADAPAERVAVGG